MKPTLETYLGQPGWRLRNRQVDLRLTRTAGMLGPVTFQLPDGRKVSPFAVAPWATEKLSPGTPQILAALRGDFFCAPFGGNGTAVAGEKHPPHGESANADWTLAAVTSAGDAHTLHAHLATRVRRGRIDKRLTLRDGHAAVYCEHMVSGMSGTMPLGTHPCFRFPDGEDSARISVGGWSWGQVLPVPLELPAGRGYSALKPGARFRRLDRVPLAAGGFADLTHYPARRGFEDLVMLMGSGKGDFGWSAITYPQERYCVLQIKDPRVLQHTILWHSNGGRHYPPWNGRHVDVLGMEEVTSYFHFGLAESVRANSLRREGLPTAVRLDRRRPRRVAHLFAVVAVPRGFDRVADVRAIRGGVEVVAANGRSARAPLDLAFVRST
jgi:hypothetical protein